MVHCFTDMKSIILFLYRMCDRYENTCTLETPHTTDLYDYKCEKHSFLKVGLKRMRNDDPNEMKIYNFRTYIQESTTIFRMLFVEYIFTQ